MEEQTHPEEGKRGNLKSVSSEEDFTRHRRPHNVGLGGCKQNGAYGKLQMVV